ncbi:helix-turn-helix domain-containing protein [Streptomyces sp. NPDC001571]
MSDEPSYTAGLLLAAIRAAGQVSAPRDASVTAQSAQAATLAGRALLELRAAGETRSTLRLSWPVGNAPNEEHLGNQVPAPLPRLVTLVFAMCVKAAWPDPTVPLYPGQPFHPERIATACQQLGAHAERVSAALERILPEHGLIASDGQLLRLGPAVACLPSTVLTALRRGHHRLPGCPDVASPEQAASETQPPPPLDLSDPNLPTVSSSEQVARSVVTALEAAKGPLTQREVRALADPQTRSRVEEILSGLGRCLVSTPNGTWTTGYPDHVAGALRAAGIGTLDQTERAVLALVLVHTVALPRAQGRHTHQQWTTDQHPVTVNELARNRALTQTAIRQALRTLRAAGMVDTVGKGNYIPGPALQRLSPARTGALWEDLILAGRPGGHLARAIADRRAVERTDLAPREDDQ